MGTAFYCPLGLYSTDFAACAVCFSLRAAFRVCHDLLSVFGLGFSFFFCDSRAGVAVVDAMFPLFQSCRLGARVKRPEGITSARFTVPTALSVRWVFGKQRASVQSRHRLHGVGLANA